MNIIRVVVVFALLMFIVPLSVIAGTESKPVTINLGKFLGKVTYDAEKDYYYLELKGARFPLKTNPQEALKVLLEAPGKDELEKNSALLLGLLGKDIFQVTILINPDEQDELAPALADLERYLKMVGRGRYAGVAYSKPAEKLSEQTVTKGAQVQSFQDNATVLTPLIQIKGSKGGAESTAVKVLGEGRFIIEGETYNDVYKATNFVCLTILKMLCGSSSCPDASACATSGDCGCSR